MKRTLRAWHRRVSIIIALPLLLVIVTGLVLQVRNQSEWIQPKSLSPQKVAGLPTVSFEQIMAQVSERQKEIEQIIFRPHKNNIAVRFNDGMEYQFHPQTGEIIKKAMRRTNILIELHQGSFAGGWATYVIFLPAGLGLFFLLISGLIIYPRKYQ